MISPSHTRTDTRILILSHSHTHTLIHTGLIKVWHLPPHSPPHTQSSLLISCFLSFSLSISLSLSLYRSHPFSLSVSLTLSPSLSHCFLLLKPSHTHTHTHSVTHTTVDTHTQTCSHKHKLINPSPPLPQMSLSPLRSPKWVSHGDAVRACFSWHIPVAADTSSLPFLEDETFHFWLRLSPVLCDLYIISFPPGELEAVGAFFVCWETAINIFAFA